MAAFPLAASIAFLHSPYIPIFAKVDYTPSAFSFFHCLLNTLESGVASTSPLTCSCQSHHCPSPRLIFRWSFCCCCYYMTWFLNSVWHNQSLPPFWNIFFTLLKITIDSWLSSFHTGCFFYDSLLISLLMSYFLTFVWTPNILVLFSSLLMLTTLVILDSFCKYSLYVIDSLICISSVGCTIELQAGSTFCVIQLHLVM